MATYAIGDIQGCFAELNLLLEKIGFDRQQDQVWFTGDLVNRGPQSLDTIRFVKSLGKSAVCVMGNHELHLLAVAAGAAGGKSKDTFEDILTAPDRKELLEWIRFLPLLHVDDRFYLIHAGLAPEWELSDAVRLANEVEAIFRSDQYEQFFPHMYGNSPAQWSEQLKGWDRIRFIVNCFTRLRYIDADGRAEFREKRHPSQTHLRPWFEASVRKQAEAEILFGHWSNLGFHHQNGCYCLDTGCVWGGELTALRIDGTEMYRTSIEALSKADLAGEFNE